MGLEGADKLVSGCNASSNSHCSLSVFLPVAAGATEPVLLASFPRRDQDAGVGEDSEFLVPRQSLHSGSIGIPALNVRK